MEPSSNPRLRKKLEELINSESLEGGSNTPDYILANYLIRCLENFDVTVQDRDIWYGATND